MFFISRNLQSSSSISERSITRIKHTERSFFFAMIGKEICKENRNKSRLIVTATIEKKYVSFLRSMNIKNFLSEEIIERNLCLKRAFSLLEINLEIFAVINRKNIFSSINHKNWEWCHLSPKFNTCLLKLAFQMKLKNGKKSSQIFYYNTYTQGIWIRTR